MTPDWITVALLVSFLSIVSLRLLFRSQFTAFSSLIVNNQYFATYGKDINNTTQRFSASLWLIRHLIMALAIFFVADYVFNVQIELVTLLRLGVFFTTLFGMKYFFEKVMVSILGAERIFQSYHFQKHALANYSAMFLLPFMVYISYAKWGVKFALFTMIAFFMMLIFIGLYILFKNHQKAIKGHLFYFILYLCALEIAPLVVLAKFLISNNKLII